MKLPALKCSPLQRRLDLVEKGVLGPCEWGRWISGRGRLPGICYVFLKRLGATSCAHTRAPTHGIAQRDTDTSYLWGLEIEEEEKSLLLISQSSAFFY